MEKQLGRENTRCDLTKPTLLELNDNVTCIDCGADFTLILTDTLTIKAFGNNNMGQVTNIFFLSREMLNFVFFKPNLIFFLHNLQCGREMNQPDRNGYAGKLVRLRVSKRIVRLPDTSQCIDQPIEVPLPRPKIRMNFDAVRYLKSIPKFRPEFISREIFRTPCFPESPSSENFECNSLSSENDEISSMARQLASTKLSLSPNPKSLSTIYDQDVTSEFIHYCLFILHGIYDAHKILGFTTLNEFKVRILMLNYYVKEAFSLCLAAAKDTIAMHQSQDDDDLDNMMLTSYVIKLFEYFTKDANIVPIHRTDLKFLIYAIFMYFIENSLSLEPLEDYFLNNVDHYLFGLAYVLFFCTGNTKLERQLRQKYSHLFDGEFDADSETNGSSTTGDEDDTTGEHSSQTDQNDNQLDYDTLFKNVSTSFKAIICQRLIKFDKELN